MTQDAFAKAASASDPELHIIEGASHIETYFVPPYVDEAVQILAAFFDRTLKG